MHRGAISAIDAQSYKNLVINRLSVADKFADKEIN